MASTIPSSTKFTPLQQELLKLYSLNLPEEDLLHIKDMIGNFLFDKLQGKVDGFVERKNLSNEDFENWLNEKS